MQKWERFEDLKISSVGYVQRNKGDFVIVKTNVDLLKKTTRCNGNCAYLFILDFCATVPTPCTQILHMHNSKSG